MPPTPTIPPKEPPPSRWEFPPTENLDSDFVGVGGDLYPGTLLEAYRRGIFAMPVSLSKRAAKAAPARTPPARTPPAKTPPTKTRQQPTLGWWSPNPRGVLVPKDIHQSRSLKRSRRRFRVTVDLEFEAVVAGCRAAHSKGVWLTPEMQQAYKTLFELGWAHSIEVWEPPGQLAGGLFGIAIGQLFVGESMFSATTDASKTAMATLAEAMADQPGSLIDVQWRTRHLASLGVTEISRAAYEARISELVKLPPLKFFRQPAHP